MADEDLSYFIKILNQDLRAYSKGGEYMWNPDLLH